MASIQRVTSSEATSNPHARVLTWQQADLLSPYEALERWRRHEPAALHEHEPERHLGGICESRPPCGNSGRPVRAHPRFS